MTRTIWRSLKDVIADGSPGWLLNPAYESGQPAVCPGRAWPRPELEREYSLSARKWLAFGDVPLNL